MSAEDRYKCEPAEIDDPAKAYERDCMMAVLSGCNPFGGRSYQIALIDSLQPVAYGEQLIEQTLQGLATSVIASLNGRAKTSLSKGPIVRGRSTTMAEIAAADGEIYAKLYWIHIRKKPEHIAIIIIHQERGILDPQLVERFVLSVKVSDKYAEEVLIFK